MEPVPSFTLTSLLPPSSNLFRQPYRTLLSCSQPSLAPSSQPCSLPPFPFLLRLPAPTSPSPKLSLPSTITATKPKPAWTPISSPVTSSTLTNFPARAATKSKHNSAATSSTSNNYTLSTTATTSTFPAASSITGSASPFFPASHSRKPNPFWKITRTKKKIIFRTFANPDCSLRTETTAKFFCSFTARPSSPRFSTSISLPAPRTIRPRVRRFVPAPLASLTWTISARQMSMNFSLPILVVIYGSSAPGGTSRKKTAAPTFKSKLSNSAAPYPSLLRGSSIPSFATFQKLFSRTCSAQRKKPSTKNPPRPQTNPFHKSFHHGRHLFRSLRSACTGHVGVTRWPPLRGLSSVRQRLSRLNHANIVVSESVMHFFNFYFRHVAGGTFCGRHRTRFAGMGGGDSFALAVHVAPETFRIVHFRALLKLLMRIMASDAGNPRITRSPAFAVLQTIGLRTHRWRSFHRGELHVPPRRVAGAAEIDRIRRRKFACIENKFAATGTGDFALQHFFGALRGHMLCARAMAGFAGDPISELRLLDDRLRGYSGGVALEAAAHFFRAERARYCFGDIARRFQRACGRKIDSIQSRKIRGARFIPCSVTFIQIRLADVAEAKSPGQ